MRKRDSFLSDSFHYFDGCNAASYKIMTCPVYMSSGYFKKEKCHDAEPVQWPEMYNDM
jgi:hypothetical protein